MKISWESTKQALWAACGHVSELKKAGMLGEKALRDSCMKFIYHSFYRPTQRTSQKQDYETNQSAWSAFSSSAVLTPSSKWDNRLLQMNTPQGNLFSAEPQAVSQATNITAIYHQVRGLETRSRIQIVTRAGFSGQPLYEKLLEELSRHVAVSAWKVMNPTLGSTGPDSAVVYLNQTLDSLGAQEVLDYLDTTLSAQLESLSPPPLGLEPKKKGIYGLDLPSRQIQINLLGIDPKDTDSAGMIISAVISRAAIKIDGTLRSQAGDLKMFNSDRDRYFKEFFGNVLRLDLGWQLV